jgi:hypothetical protein
VKDAAGGRSTSILFLRNKESLVFSYCWRKNAI